MTTSINFLHWPHHKIVVSQALAGIDRKSSVRADSVALGATAAEGPGKEHPKFTQVPHWIRNRGLCCAMSLVLPHVDTIDHFPRAGGAEVHAVEHRGGGRVAADPSGTPLPLFFSFQFSHLKSNHGLVNNRSA